jgi:[protein-PII] uridylyltransferase
LFQIFDTNGKHGIEITHARINTEKGAAIDSFCLTGADGKKITDTSLLHRLKADLEQACLIPA